MSAMVNKRISDLNTDCELLKSDLYAKEGVLAAQQVEINRLEIERDELSKRLTFKKELLIGVCRFQIDSKSKDQRIRELQDEKLALSSQVKAGEQDIEQLQQKLSRTEVHISLTNPYQSRSFWRRVRRRG
jgi:chromosome segregation ATPase